MIKLSLFHIPEIKLDSLKQIFFKVDGGKFL